MPKCCIQAGGINRCNWGPKMATFLACNSSRLYPRRMETMKNISDKRENHCPQPLIAVGIPEPPHLPRQLIKVIVANNDKDAPFFAITQYGSWRFQECSSKL